MFLCKTEELILLVGSMAIIDEENWFACSVSRSG